jgi:3-hydroxyisobutyrate dehydrogenase-like beta-hydroxyacid dehydrogenase
MKRVGVVGLGEMGLPMAQNLVVRGFDVTGYDVRPQPGQVLRESGGNTAPSAGDAARDQDAVVVMVRTPVQAEHVVLDPGGVLERARPGATLIVMSTIGVACMRRLGHAARERRLGFLDAPVSGGRTRAESGTLTIIVGGSAEDLAAARPVLGALGSQIEHVGDIGAGTAVKMANQALLTVSLLAAREAAELARAQGVSTQRLWEVLRTCTGTTWVVENWPTVASWLDGTHLGPLDILVKDTGLALDLVRERNLPAQLLPLSAQLIQDLSRSLAR